MFNLFHLKCFHDTALMGTLSEAARRNFISQPAVSKAIAKLEEGLGVTLCYHQKQKFKLTPEGEIVYLKSKEIFSSIRKLKDALDQHAKEPRMPLHFVATHSIGLSLFPDLIPQFREAYPAIELHFLFGGVSQIKGWLKQGIAEFALVIESRDFSDYSTFPLYTGQFRIFKHKDETRPLETVGCYVENEKGFLVEEYLKSANESIKLAAELNSWELIARTVESHGGYGLIPDIVVLSGRYPHLVPATSISVPYTLTAIFPKEEQLSYSAQTFLKQLKFPSFCK